MEISKYHNQSKKLSIKCEIEKQIDELLDVVEKAGNLDYFTIEIKSHEGSLNVECNLKNRKRVY